MTRRLVLYFSVTLLVFALVIGGVFGFLFRFLPGCVTLCL